MKEHKNCILLILILICTALFPSFAYASPGTFSTDFIRRATVKIINTYIRPNFYMPWKMNDPQTHIGSGVIINGNYILTNAHIVSDSSFLQVQKENDPNFYNAKVEFLGHDCDLALLRINDPGFFKGTSSLKFGGIPERRSKVTAYGYPEGGEQISITEGIVSRIEIGSYAHSGKASLLEIQTDAAINPGNSGGPAIQKNLLVGVTFQSRVNASNIGFLIPVPIITHFLNDIKDGSYNGFPSLGIFVQELRNSSHREYLGMKKNETGIMVTHVLANGSTELVLFPGDIIMRIDSIPIANDGSYEFLGGRIRFSHIIDQKQIGDAISMSVLRKGHITTQKIILKPAPVRIPWYNEFNTKPRYHIVGGIIFQTLCKEYLMVWNEWWTNASEQLLYPFFYHDIDMIDPWRKEFVLINHVLPDPDNTYISSINDRIVEEVNGKKIACLEDVVEAFKTPKNRFHVIKIADVAMPILLDADKVKETDKRIFQKYNIAVPSSLQGDNR